MRVSTPQLFKMGISSVLDQQSKVSQIQQQIASGKRIQKPSDDPAGAVQILDLRQGIDTTKQYQENINIARQRLALADGTLNGAVEVVRRVHELAIQANNDSNSPESRIGIAREIRQRLDDLMALANTADANGEYIFAGLRSKTEPFSAESDGSFRYHGDQGQRLLQISPTRQLADRDSGSDIFLDIPTGNGHFQVADGSANSGTGIIDPGTVTDQTALDGDTYRIRFTNPANDPSAPANTYQVLDSAGNIEASGAYEPGAAIRFNGIQTSVKGVPNHTDEFTVSPSTARDLFSTVRDLALALESDGGDALSRSRLHNSVNRVLMNLDQAQDRLLDARSAVGARLNAADTQESINEDIVLNLSKTLSSIEDLDLAEAASLLQQQLAGLEAAQASFVRVQGLSLFDYLG